MLGNYVSYCQSVICLRNINNLLYYPVYICYTLNMKASKETIINSIHSVINKILFMKKKSLFQFQGVEFYPSEIHLILIIREKTATNATKMAKELGVTKGAVSQTLNRLEKKGIIKKTKDPYKKNELTLSFTPFGAEAFKYYKSYAARSNKKQNRHLDQFSDNEKESIQRFLSELENMFD
jgi:DNA-binding MarR family transcriptional regulator